MKLIQQPIGSNLCGQACVAMICEVSLEKACQLVGIRSGTKTKQLARAIRKLGYRCDDRLTRLNWNYNWLMAQERVLTKITWDEKTSRWHWVVTHDRKIYDPAWGNVIEDGYEVFHRMVGGRPTSYLQVQKGRPAVELI